MLNSRPVHFTSAAVLCAVALAGCSSSGTPSASGSSATSTVATPTQSPTPTPTPSPSASLSREAKLAVARCSDALSHVGSRLNAYVADGSEYWRSEAESYVQAAHDACEEAATQVEVDGFLEAALMISDLFRDEMMPLDFGLAAGNPDSLKDNLEYWQFLGPIRQWEDDLMRELGIFPPE